MIQAGGFDKLLLDSLYEDETARRHLEMQNAGYGHTGMFQETPFQHPNLQNQHDPFAISNTVAPPMNVQMALLEQQQQHMFQQQHNMMVPYNNNNNNAYNYNYNYNNQFSQPHFPPQQMQPKGSSNPFADPLPVPNNPYNSVPQSGNYNLL